MKNIRLVVKIGKQTGGAFFSKKLAKNSYRPANLSKFPKQNSHDASSKSLHPRLTAHYRRMEAFTFLTAIMPVAVFSLGAYKYFQEQENKRSDQQILVGRALAKEIETEMEKLMHHRRLLRKTRKEGGKLEFASMCEYESDFGRILRRIVCYDNSVVPDKLKIECAYQLARLRKIVDEFIITVIPHLKIYFYKFTI